ncbi:MAG: T9SS C-terminal target domain-containing protein [Balneola sp.]|nr:MAG: T9SS C-terminal target domain-containing protein [Balneola sp.]
MKKSLSILLFTLLGFSIGKTQQISITDKVHSYLINGQLSSNYKGIYDEPKNVTFVDSVSYAKIPSQELIGRKIVQLNTHLINGHEVKTNGSIVIQADINNVPKDITYKRLGKSDLIIVDIISTSFSSLEDAYSHWQDQNWVKSISYDYIANISLQNDPFYQNQYYLKNTGQFGGTSGIDINYEAAWELVSEYSDDILVAVIDDGLEPHNDLEDQFGNSRIIGGYTPATNGNGAPALNTDYHGVAVAGIIGASRNNNLIRGISPDVEFLSVNIFAPNTTESDIAAGIIWAVDNGARVINNSWGANVPGFYSITIVNAINYAINNDVTVVFSSGNDGYVTFPSNVAGVITVSAIDNDGNISSYVGSGSEIDFVAPSGEPNGVGNVYTLDREGSSGESNTDYLTDFGGTSATAPQVSGVIALMLSIDPSLTRTEILNILSNTAEDYGSTGKDNIYGYGLINATAALYQVERGLVENKISSFESLNSTASGSNLSRRSVYESSTGAYHNLFESGSEIVYFKRLPWMTTQPIIISENQTTEYGENFNPNITIDTNGNLHAVWERKAYGSDQWKVYYSKSTNDGVTWSTPVSVSPVGSEPMNPQIVAYDAQYDNEMMLTYYYFDRIRAKMYNFSTGTWENWAAWSNNGIYNPGIDAIPGTDSYTKKFTSIASDRYGYTKMNIVYADEANNHIYYRKLDDFSDWGQYTNMSSIVPGTADHHSPSLSNDPSYTSGASPAIHLAWTRTTGTGTGLYDNKVIHRWSSSQWSWPSVYYTTYYQSQTKPTISGVGSTGSYEAYLIWEIQGNGGIARQYFNGSSWSSPVTITSNGKYPSLSTGGNQTKYIYTDENGPFYDVTLSSQTLSKVVAEDPNFSPDKMVYKRAISFMDSTGSFIQFTVHNVKEISEQGFTNDKTLKPIDQHEVDLSNSKALGALNTNEVLAEGSTLEFEVEITGNQVRSLFIDGEIPKISTFNNTDLSRNGEPLSSRLESLSEESAPLRYSILIGSGLASKSDLYLLGLENYNFKEGVFASLGHINMPKEDSSTLPIETVLVENGEDNINLSAYPNPFNPSTSISFTLSEASFVTLRVFDLLGREVAVLLNNQMKTGKHNVLFDASGLASGVYLYRLETSDKVLTSRFTLIK